MRFAEFLQMLIWSCVSGFVFFSCGMKIWMAVGGTIFMLIIACSIFNYLQYGKFRPFVLRSPANR